MARLCRVLRIDRKTGYNWLHRYEKGGLVELLKDDPGGRPIKAVPDHIRQTVLTVRKTHGWNEKKIQNALQLQGIETSFHSIRQVLADANALGVAPPRKKRTFKDFERPIANHLWQADFSLLESGEEWLFALLDDYSRYLVGAEIFADPTKENALRAR